MDAHHEPRILAIDLRAQLFGFAVLEGPRTLLDFGRKLLRSSVAPGATVHRKIAALMIFFAPSVVVLKHTSGRLDRHVAANSGAKEAIKREAKQRSIAVVFLKRKDIHKTFRQFGNSSKYGISKMTAEIYPELAWKLPPNRENYEPEHHNTVIFDAVSLGLTYLARFGEILPKGTQQAAAQPHI